MRRFSLILSVALLLVMCVPAFAQQKIAAFDIREIVERCDMTQVERQRLDQLFSVDRTRLQQLESDIRKKTEELRIQASALSLDAQQDRQTELVRLQRDYEDVARNLARRVNLEEGRIREVIIGLLNKAATQYAQTNGIDMIIETSMSVVYVSDAMNITEALLKEVNAQWKASGGR